MPNEIIYYCGDRVPLLSELYLVHCTRPAIHLFCKVIEVLVPILSGLLLLEITVDTKSIYDKNRNTIFAFN
jgi:hypothetical protein